MEEALAEDRVVVVGDEGVVAASERAVTEDVAEDWTAYEGGGEGGCGEGDSFCGNCGLVVLVESMSRWVEARWESGLC